MAGLLDLLSSGSGGGLLDFLRNNALNQQFSSGLPSDQAQYGQPQMAPPMQANAQMPIPQQPPPVIQAQPMQAPQPQPMQQAAQQPAQGPDFGDRLMAGFQGFAAPSSGGLFGHLAGGMAGFSGQGNLTEKALLAKGVDPAAVAAARNNPELMNTLIKQTYGPQTVQALGNGYIADKNGKITRAYEPEGKKSFVHMKDANGNEVSGTFDSDTGKVEWNAPSATAAPTGPVSMDELQKNDPAMASQVQAVLDGRAPYPTGSRLNPKQQQLKETVTQIDPTFDATTSKTRAKFNMEFGSTSPSTVGGQKILMGTALGHLGEVADSAAGLNNSDGGGLAMAGHGYNAVKNMSTENAAKANALEDKVAKFSGEVGKLYSGSQGGGVHEREDTRHRMGSTLTSAELASGLEASRDLILSKQKALEDQAVTIFGPDKAAKYDFIGSDGRKALDKIENAIVKLRGQNSPATPQAPALPKPGDMQGGYRFKGGNPADKANWEQAS